MPCETPIFQFTQTQDWFSHNIEHWSSLLPLVGSNCPRVLEIGSWEGRSAIYLLNHLCKDKGEIICIDHFDLFRTKAGQERFNRIIHNLNLTGKKYRVLSQFSVPALMTVLEEETTSINPGFDWIYVDGSHEADDTLLDAELTWRLARQGAIIVYDDYHWNKEPEESIHHPKRGIDAFLQLHEGEYEPLTDPSHYQVIVRKLTAMRIGFLLADQDRETSEEALGYGIHIALTIDSSYAMPAAVVMRSIVETTPGRISFYVVDCGLSSEDKERLRQSLPTCTDITLLFLALPEGSYAKEQGATWAKLDIHKVLPVERVLYLDADTLVRCSLKELWDTDLRGNPLAAVPDIGLPMGPNLVERKAYFNAGVMLMDLTKIRTYDIELHEVGRKLTNSRYRDQDALNKCFAQWTALSPKWNAQGLGTYAKYPSTDRDNIPLRDMDDPSVVHFTGPIHPTLVEVLNPYVQPPAAKPWGYAGSPGHPFADEWWSVLEKTCWMGLRTTQGWNVQNALAAERAITDAAEQFKVKLNTYRIF